MAASASGRRLASGLCCAGPRSAARPATTFVSDQGRRNRVLDYLQHDRHPLRAHHRTAKPQPWIDGRWSARAGWWTVRPLEQGGNDMLVTQAREALRGHGRDAALPRCFGDRCTATTTTIHVDRAGPYSVYLSASTAAGTLDEVTWRRPGRPVHASIMIRSLRHLDRHR